MSGMDIALGASIKATALKQRLRRAGRMRPRPKPVQRQFHNSLLLSCGCPRKLAGEVGGNFDGHP
jgi:hypothetical protein